MFFNIYFYKYYHQTFKKKTPCFAYVKLSTPAVQKKSPDNEYRKKHGVL